jgi:hypothetical protein
MEDDPLEPPKSFSLKLGKIGFGFSDRAKEPKKEIVPAGEPNAKRDDAADEIDDSSSLARALLGPVGALAEYHFPPEVIGGCCPRVAGEELDIVWNAAAEAVDSERIHVVWQTQGERIWYLAVRSSELSSHSNTWCPFASLLPGLKDAVLPPVCYTYFSDESATMMTIMDDRLQIHRGTSSVVRAKAERMSRELGGAPVIDLIPDRIEKLAPVPWYSLSLFEERARRILATVAVLSAIAFAGFAIFIWLVAAMATVSAHGDMASFEERSQEKSLQLMKSVQALRASPMREQLAKFADLNDGLITLNGMLEIYEIKNGKILWRAVVPPNITSDRISELGGQTLDSSPQRVIIGNTREALDLGAKK